MNRRGFFGLLLGAGAQAAIGKPSGATQEPAPPIRQDEEVARMMGTVIDSMKASIRDVIELKKLINA